MNEIKQNLPTTTETSSQSIKTPINIQSPNQTPTKNKHLIIYIILIVIILLLSFAVLWLLFSQEKKAPNPSPSPILPTASQALISPSLEPSPSANITESWNTYKNDKYNFQFQYPKTWYVNENNTDNKSVMVLNYDLNTAPGREYVPTIDGDLFKIEIYANEDYSNVNSWFENEKQKINPITEKPYEYLNVKDINVAGQKGIFYELLGSQTELLVGNANFETPGNYIIHFWAGLNYEGNKEFFNQILNSFEFIKQS